MPGISAKRIVCKMYFNFWNEQHLHKSMRGIFRNTVLLVISTILFTSCTATPSKELTPGNIIFSCQYLGNIDNIHFNQPSGICFHSKRGTLFVVGNLGDVCEIETDGTVINQKRVLSADFEGITHDPSTGRLYIAIEGQEKIIELDPDTFEMIRVFTIPRVFKGKTLLEASEDGIEAITFLPDTNHPHGGTFYIANQSIYLEGSEDLSLVLEIEVPLRNKTDTDSNIKIIKVFSLGVIDLSGLFFDKTTGHLYVISDMTNTIFEFTQNGKLLSGYALPGDNQEGITFDDQGFMYIAQDSGGIIKFKRIK
jgi:hypothetical protein